MESKVDQLKVFITNREYRCDGLLAAMHERSEARMRVRDAVAEILNNWQ